MKIKKIFAFAAFLTIFAVTPANAQSLTDLLGGLLGSGQSNTGSNTGSSLGSTLGNLLEGVFSSSNITVADMEGEWKAAGPAVCFQSEGFLKQAGGKAAAAAVETKLEPYYQQYGLNNAVLTVQKDGSFTLNTGKLNLNGTITQTENAQQGVFEFNFTFLGKKMSSVTTYVEKTSTSMDVMFDATKLKKLVTTIGQFSGMTIVKTLTSILDSYDGLCVGFNFKGGKTNSNTGFSIGNILGGYNSGGNLNSNNKNNKNSNSNSNTNTNTNTNTNINTNSTGDDVISVGLEQLFNILGGGKK